MEVNKWSKRGQRKWVSGAGQDEIEDIGKDYRFFKENSGAKMHHCHNILKKVSPVYRPVTRRRKDGNLISF